MFDAVRNRNRGEEAKKRVLERTYSTVPAAATSPSNDMFAAVRNRSLAELVEDPALTAAKSNLLPSTLSFVGLGAPPKIDMTPVPEQAGPIDFKADQARKKQEAPFQGKLPAPSVLQFPQQTIQSTLQGKVPAAELLGKPVETKPQTQYEITQKEIANSGAPSWVKSYADFMNWLTRGNPVGQAVSNAFAGNSGAVQRDSTGNRVVDKATDIVNDFITPLLVPTGAPIGRGPNVGTYEIAGKALSKGPGQAAVNTVAKGISKVAPKVGADTAQTIARQGLSESIAGPLQGVAAGLTNQQDSNEEIRNNALMGLGAGAVLGFGGAAAGAGLRALTRPRSAASVVEAPSAAPNPDIIPVESAAAAPVSLRSVGESLVAPPTVEPTVPQLSRVATSEPEVQLTVREQEINAKPLSEWTQDDIDYLMERTNANIDEAAAQPAPVTAAEPAPLQINEPILRPGQFDEQSGLGIAAGSKTKPYDSLKTETRSQLVTRQQKDPVSIKGTSDRAYTALVDDLHPLNQQDKILENLMEEPLKASERVHTLGLASRGADVISKRIITDGLVDSNGQVVGDSLKSILKPLNTLMKKNKHIYVDFEDYLINKHALTRAERGEKVFRDDLEWTPDYGTQKVSEYETMFPEFKEAAEKFYAFNQQMVKSWLVDTGIITQDTAQAWIDKNPYYVPNKRQFTKLEKTGKSYGGGKQGFANQSNPVKGYQKGGSQRKIISPIEATIENVDAYVKAAKRNQVMQQYVRNIEQAPDSFKDWAEIVKQPEKPTDIRKLLLTDDMEADGIDNLLARFSDDFDAAMQRTRLDKDNVVRVMVDGEPVHVQIKDKQLLSALTALGPESAGWMLNLVGKVTNNMKLLTTGSNPVFSLTRNLFRDVPQAYIASTTRDNPIAFVADLVSAAIDIGGRRGAYKQFLDIGGGHASSIAADRNLLAQSKRAVLPGMNAPVRRNAGRAKDLYENILNAVEIAPRLAEFKRAQKQTGDLQAALAAAQDVTVNFKRRGALSKEIDKVFPYFNAAAQGLDKTFRTYKDNPAKALTKSILAITIPSLALYAMNHDDPEYQKLSRKQKDAFLMIPKGDGTFFKVAKPQEQGTIFSDIPERLMQLFAEEDPAAFRDFADRLRTTFTPPGLQGALKKGGVTDKLLGAAGDTIFGPIADLAANKNFSGSAIVPAYLENLSPELQYDAKTTNVAKKIGELTGTSPKQMDYLARQYTGFLGQFGQPLLSPGGDVGNALVQQVTADPVFSNDLSTEFYHYKDRLDQANNDSDLKDLPDWYNDSLRKKLAKISKSMSAIRADMRDVQNDTSISNREKRDELRKLQQSINDMAQRGNELARDRVPY
jgi:hypothetical protein